MQNMNTLKAEEYVKSNWQLPIKLNHDAIVKFSFLTQIKGKEKKGKSNSNRQNISLLNVFECVFSVRAYVCTFRDITCMSLWLFIC